MRAVGQRTMVRLVCAACGAAREMPPSLARLRKTTLCRHCSSVARGTARLGVRREWVRRR
jgi:hypothetical protein